jgi:hypothetical protein
VSYFKEKIGIIISLTFSLAITLVFGFSIIYQKVALGKQESDQEKKKNHPYHIINMTI